jgi:hypothetical protein
LGRFDKTRRADPERFLCRRYAGNVRADELIDWMEFAHADEKGIGWIDDLRAKRSKDSWRNRDLWPGELLEVDLFRRIVSRNRIYQGYCSQYQYFKQQKIRPSAFQRQIDKLDQKQMVGGTFLLIANDVAGSENPP